VISSREFNLSSQNLGRRMLCYGSEAWTVRKQDNKITACEMIFMQRRGGCIKWDHKRSENISDKL